MVENREELVGRVIKKKFTGFGHYTGVIESYDPSSGFFRVLYEDGDSEEMEFSEIAPVLQEEQARCSEEQIQKRKRGRPKKRRRKQEKQEVYEKTGDLKDTQIEKCGSCDAFGVTQTGNSGSYGESENTQTGENGSEGVVEETQVRESGFCERFAEIHDGDLKGKQEKDGGFEGNLVGNVESGVVEVSERKGSGSCEGFADTHVRDGSFSGDAKEREEKDAGLGGNSIGIVDSGVTEETQKDRGVFEETQQGRGVFEETQVKENVHVEDFAEIESKENGCSSSSADNQRGKTSHGQEEQGNFPDKCLETPYPASKRRKPSENAKLPVLRRSARRTSGVSCSSENPVSDMENIIAKSDGDCVGSSTKIVAEQLHDHPQKFPLPPSSKNLDIDELPILDLFSVYSCLRSFSTFLFLSPFSLEAFVASLKCKFANSLIDSLHLSLLQALKRHLDFQPVEGSNSATTCSRFMCRNLDWGLLDLITWPVYLAEYLLIRGLGLLSGLELGRVKLLNGEYYKHSATLKLDILRHLCDDVLEVESIRLELDRRAMASELYSNMEGNGNLVIFKKRKDSGSSHGTDAAKVYTELTDLGNSCLTEEAIVAALPDSIGEDGDLNSDECCLCKMDGSLICCDGCPAAYHSRCLGIAKALLPEGDWYCPECVMNKQDGWLKSSKPLKGAVLLGTDLSGHLYFGCGDYLLVSDSCDAAANYYYYNKSDLRFFLDALKSSDVMHTDIVNAISSHWDIPINSTVINRQLNLESRECCIDMDIDTQKNSAAPEDVRISETNGKFDHSEISHSTTNADNPELFSKSTNQDLVLDKHKSAPIISCGLKFDPSRCGEIKEQSKPGCYVNCYSFGHIASSVAEELTCRPSDNRHASPKIVSESELISAQLKIISDKSTNFCWPSIDAKSETGQENCGWCFSCKSESERDCLFTMADKRVLKGSDKTEAVGFRSKRNRKSHLSSVVRYILSIEDRLSGLLCGPWQNPNYSKLWRKNILKALNVESLKYHLLQLESNIRHLALSAEWFKYVDSAVTMGSAFHVSTSLVNAYAKHGIGKKRLKKNISDSEAVIVSDAAARSGIRWWRGGQLSRQVFHWKALPQSLASKGARQAGCKKIPGILYPEGSEFAKRSKFVAWRAAVEMSVTVAQLGHQVENPSIFEDMDDSGDGAVPKSRAAQVRDLDSHIKWNELASTELFPQSAKGAGKSGKRLKKVKVTIRRKRVEGMQIKYLLDFGKGRHIPDTVIKNGTRLEETSSIREKYWLDESYVPLNLLRAYEDKKLTRSGHKKKHEPVSEEGQKRMKPLRRKGFSHLLSRAEKNDNCQCGHCNKDVLIRDAVCCHLCKDEWWGNFGIDDLELQTLAIRILSQTCSSSGCERNWSVFERIHTKRRNRLEHKRLNDLVYTHYNLRLKERQASRKSLTDPISLENIDLTDDWVVEAEDDDAPLLDVDEIDDWMDVADAILDEGEGGAAAGFFHKRHIAVSTSSAKRTYTCYRCRDGKNVKIKNKTQKIKSGKCKIKTDGRSRGTVKKVKYVSLQSKKLNGFKKKKSSKTTTKRSVKADNRNKRPRTEVIHAYWLNGLHLNKKLNDGRGMCFRESKVLLPFKDSTTTTAHPICFLCHKGYDSGLIYIGCENCEEWYHGDAFGVTTESFVNMLGFRCHKCRNKKAPMCPYSKEATINERHVDMTLKSGTSVKTFKVLVDDSIDKIETEMYGRQKYLPIEDSQGSVPSAEHMLKEQKMDPILDSNQNIMLEKYEAKSAIKNDGLEEKQAISELVEVGTHWEMDPILDSNPTVLLEECKSIVETGQDDIEEKPIFPELVVAGTPRKKVPTYQDLMLKKYKTKSEMKLDGVEEISTVAEFIEGGTLWKTDPIRNSNQTYILEKYKTKSEVGHAHIGEIATVSKLVEVEMHMETDLTLDSNQSHLLAEYTIKSELKHNSFEETPTISELVGGGTLGETDPVPYSSQVRMLENCKTKSDMGQNGIKEVTSVSMLVEAEKHMEADPTLDSNQTPLLEE